MDPSKEPILDDLESQSPPIDNSEQLKEETVQGELKLRTSLDFSHYLTTKNEFEAKQQEFEAKQKEFEQANITQDQKKSLDNHNLDYDSIGKLEQKPLPDNRDNSFFVRGYIFDKAIFVGFLNEDKGTESGTDVFLKTDGIFTTSDYQNAEPAKEKDTTGERIKIFVENKGYRFVTSDTKNTKEEEQKLIQAAKLDSQQKRADSQQKRAVVGGKSKKRVKRNSNNKSKRRYKK